MPLCAAPPPYIETERDLEHHIEALVAAHAIFAPVRKAAGQVPLRWLDAGFSGLAWVITSQQISIAAGRAIFARVEASLGELSPETILRTADETLRSAGLSAPKIRTLRAAAHAVKTGAVDLARLRDRDAPEAISHLTAIKGIGPWTAEVYLIFATGHADIMPAKDVALQEAARLAFGLHERPAEKTLIRLAEDWRPYRSAAARLLWAYYRAVKTGRETAPLPAGG